jgi:SAM-dependent methyltransferase
MSRALTYGACYAAFYGTGPAVEVPFLVRLARSVGLTGDLHVLDIGCGTGRLLGPLAALGWKVVGMDPQPENLAEARRVAAQTPGVVEVEVGGFSDLDAVDAFDVIVALGGPWWYLLTAGERSDALSRVRRALRGGGVVVLDGPNLEWLLDHYSEPKPSEADVEGIRVRRVPRHDIDRASGIWTHIDRFSAQGASGELVMVHRLAIIPVDEVVSALQRAGLGHLELYPSWASTEAAARLDGPRLIAVGRRLA